MVTSYKSQQICTGRRVWQIVFDIQQQMWAFARQFAGNLAAKIINYF
jgi:hypothetical protein